jgi:hypothetical protein
LHDNPVIAGAETILAGAVPFEGFSAAHLGPAIQSYDDRVNPRENAERQLGELLLSRLGDPHSCHVVDIRPIDF